jgi:Family of unknown function (DUF6298)
VLALPLCLENKNVLLRIALARVTLFKCVCFPLNINSLGDTKGSAISGTWIARSALKPKISRPLSDKGKPVVRLGRKATDQVENLKAGLPNRGVVDLQGVGSQWEEILCPGSFFFAGTYHRLVSSPLYPKPLVLVGSWRLLLSPVKAAGPLSVGSTNPRFFVDSTGKTIYLTGVHLNNSLIDRSDKATLDFTGYLNFLQQYEHNFIRLWAWEQAAWTNETTAKITFDPLPYQRKGPGTALDGGRKFDLTRFNQAYFDRLRSRVLEAGERGIYVSVMLFQGFSSQRKTIGGGNPWSGHPFNLNNNINGINGDPSGNDNGEEVHSLIVPAITSLQQAYVRKVIDTLNDLDNALYEISGDAPASSKRVAILHDQLLEKLPGQKTQATPRRHEFIVPGQCQRFIGKPGRLDLAPRNRYRSAVGGRQQGHLLGHRSEAPRLQHLVPYSLEKLHERFQSDLSGVGSGKPQCR